MSDAGWRFWRLDEDGWLVDPFPVAGVDRDRRWMPDRTAECDHDPAHVVPAARCGCGIHYLPDPVWCVDFVTQDPTADVEFWARPVFGTVTVTGPTREEPYEPGVLRAAHGAVGDVLVVPHHLADEATRLADRYSCEVRVSSDPGVRYSGPLWAGRLPSWAKNHPLHRPSAPDEDTGWRWWLLSGNGRLNGLYRSPYPWWPTSGVTSLCFRQPSDHHLDEAPQQDCTCGTRLHPSLPDLLDGIAHSPRAAGLREWTSAVGAPFAAYRCQLRVDEVPDVIGQVVGWGDRANTASGDLGGMLRYRHARPGRVLHLSSHLVDHVPKVRRAYPDATVIVGQARGLAWLDEIRAYTRRAG